MVREELENLFRKVTLEMLNLPDNLANASRVRISWGQIGAPAWGIGDNVAFLRVYPSDGPYNRPKDIQYRNNDSASLIRSEHYTNIIAVDWIFYGPSSYDDADVVRNELSNNETLIKNNVFYVFDRRAATRTPELFNGQWWERSNYTGYFYEQVVRESAIPTIAAAPVTIKTEEGDVNIGDITP